MIYEIRTYTFYPGKLAIWLPLFEHRGYPLLIRHTGAPLCTAVSESGALNQVVQVFQYASLEDRDTRRAALMSDAEFLEYVRETTALYSMQSQYSQILRPAFAPRP